MKLLRWPLLILLPLVPVALAFVYRFLAIDACLDMGGSASSTFRTCVLTEHRVLVTSYELVNPTLTMLMLLAGLGAIVYWATLFERIERVVQILLGIQIVTTLIVAISIFLGSVHHASWQPLSVETGLLAGILAAIASIVAYKRTESRRWLLTIPAALTLAVLGFVLTVACCFRMGS